MAKFKIKAKTFNDIEICSEVEVHIVVGERKEDFLSQNAYFALESKLKKDSKLDYKFYLISKDIEELIKNDVIIDENNFIEQIYSLLLEKIQNYQTSIYNETLLRVVELYKHRKLKESKNLLENIDKNSLSKFDLDEYMVLEFKLLDDKEANFDKYKNFFRDNAKKSKEIYFDFIKYLEDKRDERKPFKLLEEFETNFSLTEFDSEEKAFYFYLKGRNYYYRGEFLLALDLLSKALKFTKKEKLIAHIYNTATNSFNDNLFFDEALQMAKKSLNIRKQLNLPEVADTYSLIGGIYLKSNKPKKAFKYLKKAKIEALKSARIYNYLAKSAILLKDYKTAKKYIKKSEKFDDSKGFLVLIKFLLLNKTSTYEKMKDLEIQTLAFAENRKKYDKVVLGWSYYLLAQKSFEKKLTFEGLQYLDKAIYYFLKDNYILEAYYVSIVDVKLNKKEKKYLQEILSNYLLKEKFDEYVQKHKNIADKYCGVFKIHNFNERNLEKFPKKYEKYFLI